VTSDGDDGPSVKVDKRTGDTFPSIPLLNYDDAIFVASSSDLSQLSVNSDYDSAEIEMYYDAASIPQATRKRHNGVVKASSESRHSTSYQNFHHIGIATNLTRHDIEEKRHTAAVIIAH
jgi:hypothetical protein